MFNYGSFKLFLLKVFFGFVLISISLFLILSLITQNPSDPGFGKLVNKENIANFLDFQAPLSQVL